MRRPLPFALATAVVAVAACSSPAQQPASPSTGSPEYRNAYEIGLDAYTYGLPLLTTDATYRTMTSVDVPQGAFGPVNRFNNVRSPNTSGSTAVVAPGATSLSSIAWLDLADEPQVVHVPQVTDHYFVLALLDPYTENLVNLGTASGTTPGDYVVTDPEQAGTPIPRGTTRIAVDQSRIWVIGSTQLKGAGDIPAVNAIQDQYSVTPLSRYGTGWTAPAPTGSDTTVDVHSVPSGIAFFDALGDQLAQFPPPGADSDALARFATVGVGAGRTPSTDPSLSPDTLRGLTDAVAAGPQHVQQDVTSLYRSDSVAHAGYLLGGFGRYDTDYVERAVISQIGLGALVPQQAIYAMAWDDASGRALQGSSAYVLHLTTPPPTEEGWSVTVYTLKGELVSGSGGRTSALTSTSPLTTNGDGSVDLYLQPTEPTSAAEAANWVPTPSGQGFEVTWRLFAPRQPDIDGVLDGSGWQPPVVRAAGS